MLYQAYQAHSDIMVPVRTWADCGFARVRAAAGGRRRQRGPAQPDGRPTSSSRAPGSRMRARPSASTASRSATARWRCDEEAALTTPFGTLLHFKKDVDTPQPRVLLVAPLSGHFATLLRGTVRTMLPEHDVYITDWHNVRDVRSDCTAASASTNISSHLIRFLEAIGPGAHVVAVCQPCVAVLVAAAVMAQSRQSRAAPQHDLDGGSDRHPRQSRPRSTSSPIRSRWNGSSSNLIATVPLRYPGAFRRVYPASCSSPHS